MARHMEAVIDLLGQARRSAAPPPERVAIELWDFIEDQQTAKSKAEKGMPEPTALAEARRLETDAGERVEKLKQAVSEAKDALAKVIGRPGPIFFGRSEFALRRQVDQQRVQARQGGLESRLKNAERVSQDAQNHRERLERSYRVNALEFSRFWQEQAKFADQRVGTAEFAKRLSERTPIFARWGSNFLYQVSTALMQARQARHDDRVEFEIPDLVSGKDIWGLPYQPRSP
jgi:hypothetical protein